MNKQKVADFIGTTQDGSAITAGDLLGLVMLTAVQEGETIEDVQHDIAYAIDQLTKASEKLVELSQRYSPPLTGDLDDINKDAVEDHKRMYWTHSAEVYRAAMKRRINKAVSAAQNKAC